MLSIVEEAQREQSQEKKVFCRRNWQATKPRAHLNVRQSKKYSTDQTQSSIQVSRQDGQTDYSVWRNIT